MTTSRKILPSEELERIEDALVNSILEASGQDIRSEQEASGEDPNALIAVVADAIDSAKAETGRRRLESARVELAAWRAEGEVVSLNMEATRRKLENLRSVDSDLDKRMTIAARKGEGLSDRDLKGLLEDLARLEGFESDKDDT